MGRLWRVVTAVHIGFVVNNELCIGMVTAIPTDQDKLERSDSFCKNHFVPDVIKGDDRYNNGDEDIIENDMCFVFDYRKEVPWLDKEVDWDDYFSGFTKNDTDDLFDCEEHRNRLAENNEIYMFHQDTWMLLRDTYNAVVRSNHESSIPFPASVNNGFYVPVQVKVIEKEGMYGGIEKQLEVRVTQPVKAGELVWVPRQLAKFNGVLDFQRFIASIPLDLACEVLHWVYAPHDGLLCMDLDEAAIITISMNDEDMDENGMDDDYFNAGCLPEAEWVPGGCDLNIFALRDIDIGERLLIDFDEYYTVPETWEWHYDFHNAAKRSVKKYQHDSLMSSFVETGELPWDDEDIDWEDFFQMNHTDIEHLLKCEDKYETEQRIPDESTWRQLQEAYRSIDGYEDAFFFPPSTNGFRVPIEIKQSEGSGRGIFLTESVKKGDLIQLPHNTAKFHKGSDYRRFVASVPLEYVCDILQWSYVSYFDEAGTAASPYIATDLDEGCLLNDGEIEDELSGTTSDDVNVGCMLEAEWVPGGCENLYALRDIEAGEELLCDYAEFALPFGWLWFNM